MENWPCPASGNIGVKKNVGEETFARLPSLRYANPESPDIVGFVCVCELRAVLARIPLGPTESLGPGFGGFLGGNLAAAAINFAAPPSKERRLRGPEIGRKSGGGGGPSRKAAPYVEVKLWQYVLKCGHRLDKEERTRRTSRLLPKTYLCTVESPVAT